MFPAFRSIIIAAFVSLAAFNANAQELLKEQPTPFSVWLDFNTLSKPDSTPPPLPIWLESFREERIEATITNPATSIFRLRLRKMPLLHQEILVRVFFDDLAAQHPVVSAWSETGSECFRSNILGTGSGLPSSEGVIVPLKGADYIDIAIPGDGASGRGAFISSLKSTSVRQSQDFASNSEIIDPFGNSTPASRNSDDTRLFGRVKAPLDFEEMRLSAKMPAGEWEFNLSKQPLMALLTFEVLNGDVTAPPVVKANEHDFRYANIFWPDLADPGYRGEARSKESGMRLQYTGWLRVQCIVPGNDLKAGLNKVIISLSQNSGPIAVRNLELQLKHNWQYFDYTLTPANP